MEDIPLTASLAVLCVLSFLCGIFALPENLLLAVRHRLWRSLGVAHPTPAHEHTLSVDELRSLVMDSEQLIPADNRGILLNLFELADITVEDVMTPRGAMEMLDLSEPLEDIHQQVATSYHTRLPVFEGGSDNILGILHIKRLLADVLGHEAPPSDLRPLLSKPYFVPAQTPVFTQLREFQRQQQRLALVVDEYGELLGLLTMEDIIEELIGKFTTSQPGRDEEAQWGKDGSVLVDGSQTLRSLNRRLGTRFPLNGPKTLNGLIVEYLQDIPESDVSMKIAQVRIEVVQTQDTRVKTARLFRS